MSSSDNTVSRNSIKELLSSIGTVDTDQAHVEYLEYDWKACHFFNNDQMEVLKEFSSSLAEIFAQTFTKACQSDYEVSIEAVRQVNAEQAVADLNQDNSKYLFLAVTHQSAAEPCGLLALPDKTTHLWARAVLGEMDTEIQDGQVLSALEESLLYDFCKRLIESVQQVNDSLILTTDVALTGKNDSVQWESTASLLQINLTVKKADQEDTDVTEAYFLLPCDCYRPIVSDDNDIPETDQQECDTSVVLKRAIDNLIVPMTAKFGTISLAIEDVMSLKKNDILVMDNSINNTVDIDLSGKNVFQGIPGKHNGKMAVLIS